MTVTVVKVFRHAQPASEFDAPESGNRLYAVQFRLSDTGTAAYSDAPSNGAAVVDAAGQSYQASITANVSGGRSFPGTENIAAGSSGLGCIVFEVPRQGEDHQGPVHDRLGDGTANRAVGRFPEGLTQDDAPPGLGPTGRWVYASR
jgi:hypothetical protein